MKAVRLRTLYAGPTGVFNAGVVTAVSDEEAASLVAGGFAEPVDWPEPEPEEQTDNAQDETEPQSAATEAADEPETATAEPPENTAQRPARRRRGAR